MYDNAGAYSNMKGLGYLMSASLDLVGASRFIPHFHSVLLFFQAFRISISQGL